MQLIYRKTLLLLLHIMWHISGLAIILTYGTYQIKFKINFREGRIVKCTGYYVLAFLIYAFRHFLIDVACCTNRLQSKEVPS